MKYKSTRGGTKGLSFTRAVLTGLAPDSGLLVPESVSRADLAEWKDLPYRDLAYRIYKLYIDDIPDQDIRSLVEKSYASFSLPEVVKVHPLNDLFLLELFYGPTFSFKDIALQFLGNLFEYILARENGRINVLGATSGDTGSAAIHGLKGKKNINVFILHPYQKVSLLQELQMTTVPDANIFNIAIKGTFDDCQKIIKDIFSDKKFKKEYSLGAVNSINWVRILAQIVYYFYAYFRINRARIDVSVPTGNFGDIFAGFMARKMGLPLRRLILATNENDILCRFVNQGDYSVRAVRQTTSPAMDIQIASNFERYLYYFYKEDALRTGQAMETFSRQKKLSFNQDEVRRIQDDFASYAVTSQEARQVISQVYEKYGCFICPHTACAVGAAAKAAADLPVLCLATAHPAKFPEVVKESTGKAAPVPEQLQGLDRKKERLTVMDNDAEQVKKYIIDHAVQERSDK